MTDIASTVTQACEMPLKSKRWRIVSLLFLGVLINQIDRGNLSVAATPMMHDLNISPAGMGVTLSAFFWTYLIFQVPAGHLVDRRGLRWSYGIAFLIWTIASVATGLAHTLPQLVLFRLLLGMSEAIATPASLAFVQQNFSEGEQGLPTAIYISGLTLGPALGFFTGGILIERVGWRALFIATGLISVPWLWPWLSSVRDRPQPPMRGASKIRSAASIPSKELRQLLSSPTMWGILLSAFCYGYFWSFCLTWLPSYLVTSRGFYYAKMGRFMAIPLVSMALSCVVFGRLADRFSSRGAPLRIRRLFVVIGFSLASSIILIVRAKSSSGVLAILLCSFTGLGLAGANYWALTEVISPAALIGKIVGFQNSFAQIGGISASIATGLLVSRSHGFQLPIELAAMCVPLAAGAILILVRNEGAPKPADP